MQTLSRTRQRSIQTPCPLHLGSEAFLWPDVPKAVTAKPRHPRRANIPQSPGHGRRCPQPGRRSRVSVKGQVRPPRGWERCSVSQGPTRVSGPSISLTHPPTTATTPLPSAHTGRPAQGLRLSPLLWPYRPKHATPTQPRTTLTPPPHNMHVHTMHAHEYTTMHTPRTPRTPRTGTPDLSCFHGRALGAGRRAAVRSKNSCVRSDEWRGICSPFPASASGPESCWEMTFC